MKFIAILTILAASLMAPAMAQDNPFAGLYGEWRGEASGIGPDRQPFSITQTERVGPMLDGRITVIEGRGYEADGTLAFNAFGIISKNAQSGEYEMRAYRDTESGTYPVELTDSGFIWEIPAGPAGVVRYTVWVEDGTWHETGEYVPAEGAPFPILEMTMTRIGDTDWPAADVVMP